jgi:parvulin-like peptidyl-prolyl isomerase
LDDATYTGGDFGYVVKGDQQTTQALGKNFVEAIFDLNANDFSPVLESSLGYYIVQITDKRSPRLLGIDDPLLPGQKLTVREQIRQVIVGQKQSKAVSTALEELLKDIRKQAEITYFEQNFTW